MNIDNTELLEALKQTQLPKPENAVCGEMEVTQEDMSQTKGAGI